MSNSHSHDIISLFFAFAVLFISGYMLQRSAKTNSPEDRLGVFFWVLAAACFTVLLTELI